jgi:hypothetical protein
MKRAAALLALLLAAGGCGGKKDENPRVRTTGGIQGQFAPNPDPPRVGLDSGFAVTLTQNGAPVTGANVNFAFFFKSMNQAGPTAVGSETSPGRYEASGVTTGMNGKWEAEVTVSRSNQPDVKLTFPFTVAR